MGVNVSIEEKASRLQKDVQSFYLAATEASDAFHDKRTLPDFREHGGVRLLKWGTLVDMGCACSSCTRHKARFVAAQIVAFENGLIRGAVGSGDDQGVVRCFLEDHELPEVFPRLAPYDLTQAPEAQRKQLRVRHVFGIWTP